MNTPAISALEQRKVAILGTVSALAAGGGAVVGGAHGWNAARPAGQVPLSGPAKAQLGNLGTQLQGLPQQLGGAVRGAVRGAAVPFVAAGRAAGAIGRGFVQGAAGAGGTPPTTSPTTSPTTPTTAGRVFQAVKDWNNAPPAEAAELAKYKAMLAPKP